MAYPVVVKVLIGSALLLGSLAGLKHLGVDATENRAVMRLMRLFRKMKHPGSDYSSSKCHACLAEGKDFCISGNKCIPRATFQCKGPHDHITGDKEFALHGNPEGIQHSMTCPKPIQKKDYYVDSKDCYFDKECHAKVDWEKIGKVKEGFFARLKFLKEKQDASGVKQMMSKVHSMFREAGMPDDRIDYILIKWVEHEFPEALVDQKDCYFDKDCHAKVDWTKIAKIKGGFFARLEAYKEKSDAKSVKEMMGKVHEMFHKSGMPQDRIDYILEKWVKSVYPEALSGDVPKSEMCEIAEMQCVKDGQKIMTGRCGVQWKACFNEIEVAQPRKKGEENDSKDCYFDKDCHAKVDWNKVGKAKSGFFARLQYFKDKHDTVSAKRMMSNMHKSFREAGVPDDRIGYTLEKWVKTVYPEALQVKTAPVTV
jgi:hypothetical protein